MNKPAACKRLHAHEVRTNQKPANRALRRLAGSLNTRSAWAGPRYSPRRRMMIFPFTLVSASSKT